MLLLVALLLQQTDTTLAVGPGSRLELSHFQGEIRVTAWERGALRVRVRGGDEAGLDVTVSGNRVSVRLRNRYGPPEGDLALQVPADMGLRISGRSGNIAIAGTRADVTVETVEGSISLQGGRGTISLSSVEGSIELADASGRMDIHAVDGDVTGRRLAGDLKVESVDGEVTLREIESANAEVNTVDGDIQYEGPLKAGGRYRLSSHDGDVTLVTPALDATVTLSTFSGGFESDFPVTVTRAELGKRMTFTQGSGSARVELESFDGDVRIRQAGRRP
ncbi:MAG TPA: DUF4097 family beta strand repeat-containing protein [Gemmatimonadales bacterium]|jgi:DUF4097 and DUF4098 domain-containing protein YvlB|nr:DUF4097 family beta strand repeat-containing protein [Gemmatimonadales bacterium]